MSTHRHTANGPNTGLEALGTCVERRGQRTSRRSTGHSLRRAGGGARPVRCTPGCNRARGVSRASAHQTPPASPDQTRHHRAVGARSAPRHPRAGPRRPAELPRTEHRRRGRHHPHGGAGPRRAAAPLEEFYVAAPAVVEDKARNGFEAAWSQAVDAIPVPSRIPRVDHRWGVQRDLREAASYRDRALVAFYVSTGARASELLSATHGGVDPGRQLITVVRKGTREWQKLPAQRGDEVGGQHGRPRRGHGPRSLARCPPERRTPPQLVHPRNECRPAQRRRRSTR